MIQDLKGKLYEKWSVQQINQGENFMQQLNLLP